MKTTNPHTPAQLTPEHDLSILSPAETAAKILTTTEAAKYLKIKASTLEQWRWNGRGPKFCKIGRSCRYLKKELDRYLEERTYVSTTDAQTHAIQ